MDGFPLKDNSIRFVVTDKTDRNSYAMKLYFKGESKSKTFYCPCSDPTFTVSRDECKNHKIIQNRLHNRAPSNSSPIDIQKIKPIFKDLKLPTCNTVQDTSQTTTSFITIMSMPEGERLDKKCIRGDKLTKNNSCIPYLRKISKGLLHALKIFNMGNIFFRHGNIVNRNIYLSMKNDTSTVFLDNMLYDSNKYDDISQKPLTQDLDNMGDALIQLLTGSANKIVEKPIKSTFDLYHSIRKYILDNNFDISLISASLNMSNVLKSGNAKCVTRTEFEYRLKKSIFNFIYRLKCREVKHSNQFMDIDQALNHDFIKSGDIVGPNAPGETWDSLPADY